MLPFELSQNKYTETNMKDLVKIVNQELRQPSQANLKNLI